MKNKRIICFILIIILVIFIVFLAYKKINAKKENKIITTKTTSKVITTTNKTTTTTTNLKNYNFELNSKNEFYPDLDEMKIYSKYVLNINNILLNNKKYTFKYINSDKRQTYLNDNLIETFNSDDSEISIIKNLNNNLLLYGFSYSGPGSYRIVNDKGDIVYKFKGFYSVINDKNIICDNAIWNSTGSAVDVKEEKLEIETNKVKIISSKEITINCDSASENDYNKYCADE